ncbi:hypothetical protein ON010_g4205 [Phytophthora cinnamomi]|nr:hypothetical protein ON010_g4205 [Phytophthora cinnamomi]
MSSSNHLRLAPLTEERDIQRVAAMEAASYPADEAASESGIRFRQKNAGAFFWAAYLPTDSGEVLVGFVNARPARVAAVHPLGGGGPRVPAPRTRRADAQALRARHVRLAATGDAHHDDRQGALAQVLRGRVHGRSVPGQPGGGGASVADGVPQAGSDQVDAASGYGEQLE